MKICSGHMKNFLCIKPYDGKAAFSGCVGCITENNTYGIRHILNACEILDMVSRVTCKFKISDTVNLTRCRVDVGHSMLVVGCGPLGVGYKWVCFPADHLSPTDTDHTAPGAVTAGARPVFLQAGTQLITSRHQQKTLPTAVPASPRAAGRGQCGKMGRKKNMTVADLWWKTPLFVCKTPFDI